MRSRCEEVLAFILISFILFYFIFICFIFFVSIFEDRSFDIYSVLFHYYYYLFSYLFIYFRVWHVGFLEDFLFLGSCLLS